MSISQPVRPYQCSNHLLNVPTLCCNLRCSYCYLGGLATEAKLANDDARAISTLRTVLQKLEDAGVVAFNVSLHGGEVTTLPPNVPDSLLGGIGNRP